MWLLLPTVHVFLLLLKGLHQIWPHAVVCCQQCVLCSSLDLCDYLSGACDLSVRVACCLLACLSTQFVQM